MLWCIQIGYKEPVYSYDRSVIMDQFINHFYDNYNSCTFQVVTVDSYEIIHRYNFKWVTSTDKKSLRDYLIDMLKWKSKFQVDVDITDDIDYQFSNCISCYFTPIKITRRRKRYHVRDL